MAIVAGEIKRYRAATQNDTSSNGGRMSSTELASGTAGLWPAASEAERTAGSTKYRKLFHKVANDDDLTLFSAMVFLERVTPGEDELYIFEGTQEDTQGAIGTPDLYGAGDLNATVISGASEIEVAVEDGAVTIFRDGDTIRISDKATVDGAGNEEYHVINGTPTVLADVWTITLTGTLANGYSNTNTTVSSVIEAGDVAAGVHTVTETTTSGTFDEAQVVVDNIGGVQQVWTITFTSATAFSVSGDGLGSVGTGNISSDFVPSNPDFSKPYFTIPSTAWGGTWAAAETVQFTTSPAAVPVWEKRIIPAGAASFAGNSRVVAVAGESA